MRRQWLNIKLTSLKNTKWLNSVKKSRPKLKKKRKTRELSRYKLTSPEKAIFYRLHDWLVEMLKFQNPIIFRLPKELFTIRLSVCLPYHPQDGQVKGMKAKNDIKTAEAFNWLPSFTETNLTDIPSRVPEKYFDLWLLSVPTKTSNDWPHGNMLSWTNWSAFQDQSHSPLAPKETIYHSLRGENCFCSSGFRYSIRPKHGPYLLEESPGPSVTAPCANYLGLPPPMCVLSRAQTSLGLVNHPLFVLSWVLGCRLFRYLSCCFRAFGLFLLAECSAYLTQTACSSCIPLLFSSSKEEIFGGKQPFGNPVGFRLGNLC